MQTLSIDLHGPVHYVDWAGDGPPMVLVHGLGGSLTNWLTVGPGLARSNRVLALDLPGFGMTPPVGRSVSIASQVATVSRFIERVAQGACTVVGNSMGGLIASTLASERPELTSRLVLVDAVLPRAAGVALDPVVTASFVAYMTPLLGGLLVRSRRRWSARRYLDETLKLCGVDSARLDPSVIDAMLEGIRYRRTTDWADRSFLDAARAVARMGLFAGRFRALLRSVRCPTLMVHGTLDRLVPVGFARAAATLCPAWDVEIMEGVGHVPQLQVPERFVEVVAGWGKRVDARAPRAGAAG